MKLNLKKVVPVLALGLMAGITVAHAYTLDQWTNPFVAGGASNVAVVVGADATSEDALAASYFTSALQAALGTGTTTEGTTVTGEAVRLDTSSDRIYLNDTISAVKDTLTKSDLPTVLADGTFSGDQQVSYTQQITLGDNRFVYEKEPTNNDDPTVGVQLNTSRSDYLYNAEVIFSKPVNFTDSDSEGETIKLFGKDFIVSTETDTSQLVLFKSATQVTLTAPDNPSVEVTIGGVDYNITLVSGSETDATIDVNGEQKEINEGSSKKVGGLDVAVKNVDESTALNKVTATLLLGAEKIVLQDGDNVLSGEDENAIDGTYVTFSGTPENLSKITISVFAPDSSADFIRDGEAFTDPVFETFKLENAGVNIPEDSSDRDTIYIDNSGDDTLTLKMTDSEGNEASFEFAHNASGKFVLANDDGDAINVVELAKAGLDEYIVIGNEDTGHLVEVTSIHNSSGTNNDYVDLRDVFTGTTYKVETWTSEGQGSVTIDGKTYGVTMVDDDTNDLHYVQLNYSDSDPGYLVLFPTIETDKGAKVSLVAPVNLSLDDIDGSGTDLAGLMVPNGNGYNKISATYIGSGGNETWKFTYDSDSAIVNTSDTDLEYLTVGQVKYWFESEGVENYIQIGINASINASASVKLTTPAVVVYEEEDDSNTNNVVIIATEGQGTSTNGVGVDEVYFSSDSYWKGLGMESVNDVDKYMDYFGTVVTLDYGDSDQQTATISYPDSQVYANLYLAESSASISQGTTGTTGGILGTASFLDTEVVDNADLRAKNLIVVGGSAVNRIAATLLGLDYPTYGVDERWQNVTGVTGDGQAYLKFFENPYASDKVALLVAGWSGQDTRKAAEALVQGMTGLEGKEEAKIDTINSVVLS